jgi:UDP-N-acetyl-2-amino-2-deoxyglucuronate dehydrogenase
VYAATRTAVHAIEVEDTAVAALEFMGGAVGTLEAATSVFPGLPRRVEITGSEGTVVVEQDRVVSVQLRTPVPGPAPQNDAGTSASATSPVVTDVRGHRRVLEDFLSAIRRGATPLCDGRDGRRSVELLEAMYRSARLGTAVAVRGLAVAEP